MIEPCKLVLNDSDYLELRVPSLSKFTPDEVEIWFVENGQGSCVYKDSYKYTILNGEVAHVLKRFFQAVTDDVFSSNFVHRYIQVCEMRICDDKLFEYLLFQKDNWAVWLFAKDNNAHIIITEFAQKKHMRFICKKIKGYIIERSEIIKWYESLLSIDMDINQY